MLAVTAPLVERLYGHMADDTSSYMRDYLDWIIVRYGSNPSIYGGTSAYHPGALMPPVPAFP